MVPSVSESLVPSPAMVPSVSETLGSSPAVGPSVSETLGRSSAIGPSVSETLGSSPSKVHILTENIMFSFTAHHTSMSSPFLNILSRFYSAVSNKPTIDLLHSLTSNSLTVHTARLSGYISPTSNFKSSDSEQVLLSYEVDIVSTQEAVPTLSELHPASTWTEKTGNSRDLNSKLPSLSHRYSKITTNTATTRYAKPLPSYYYSPSPTATSLPSPTIIDTGVDSIAATPVILTSTPPDPTTTLLDPCGRTEGSQACKKDFEVCKEHPEDSMKHICVCRQGYASIGGSCVPTLETIANEVCPVRHQSDLNISCLYKF